MCGDLDLVLFEKRYGKKIWVSIILAVQEVKQMFDIDVISIAGLDTLITYLSEKPDQADALQRIKAYQQEYGEKV